MCVFNFKCTIFNVNVLLQFINLIFRYNVLSKSQYKYMYMYTVMYIQLFLLLLEHIIMIMLQS